MDPRRPYLRQKWRRTELLDRLLHEEGNRLRRLALFHSERRQDADDALGDACVQFLLHFDGAGIDGARRWMSVVVRRCAWTIARRRRGRAAVVEEVQCEWIDGGDGCEVADGGPGPEDLAQVREEVASFAAAFSRLRSDERRVLVLLALGYSYDEMAESVGWTPRKVRRSVEEGRSHLRGLLREEGGKT